MFGWPKLFRTHFFIVAVCLFVPDLCRISAPSSGLALETSKLLVKKKINQSRRGLAKEVSVGGEEGETWH